MPHNHEAPLPAQTAGGAPICICGYVVTPSNESVQPWGPTGRTLHKGCARELAQSSEHDAEQGREHDMAEAMGDAEYAHLAGVAAC